MQVVDTTGAGDAFLGGALYKLLDVVDIANLSEAELYEIIVFANAVGGLTTTHKGSITSMPTLEQINALING